MRKFIYILTFLFTSVVGVSAQYYEGESYVPPCEHNGSQMLWEVVSYRPGLTSWDKVEGSNGVIRFSDTCIEIDCYQLVLSFGVKEYDRQSDRNFKVSRSNSDELYDYMEVRPAYGKRGYYWVHLGRLDERGYMSGVVQLTCRPYKRANVANPIPENRQSQSR